MKTIIITRNQYEKIKEVFEQNDIDHVEWTEESPSGIGPAVTLKFHNKLERSNELDITDFDNW